MDTHGAASGSHLSPIHRLKDLLFLERNELMVAVIYSVAIGLLTLAMPVAVQSLVNTVALGNLLQPLVVLTFLVGLGLILSGVLQGLRVWVVELIQRRVLVRISSDTVQRLLRARVDAFDNHHGPELVNRFFDVITLQKSGATLLVDGLSVIMQTIIGMILLAVYHPWLLAFDALLIVSILVVMFPMGSGAIVTSIAESKAKYALVAWLQEIARHNTTFKAPTASVFAMDRASRLTGEYLRERAGHFRILLRQILGTFGIYALASATLLGVGGWLVIQRELTLGQLVAAELVVGLILSGFSKLGKHMELFYDLVAAVDKLGYLQDLPLEQSGRNSLPPATSSGAALRVRNLWFAFPNKPPLLEAADWQVDPGERVGINAHSGRGKSTLLNILYGLRDATLGSVRLDGMDLREVDRSSWRGQMAMVRHTEIFEGTVSENVRLGRDGMDISTVRDALERVGILEDVLALPQGLDTELSTGGQPLSAGQAMRLMIARAIAGRPRLLLIDESLDQLDDSRGIATLMDTLFSRQACWTLIVATAKPDLLNRCDSVYGIENSVLTRMPKDTQVGATGGATQC